MMHSEFPGHEKTSATPGHVQQASVPAVEMCSEMSDAGIITCAAETQ